MLIFHLNNQLASRIMSKFKWLIFVTACYRSFRTVENSISISRNGRLIEISKWCWLDNWSDSSHHFEMRRFRWIIPKYEFSHDFIGEFFATVNSLAKDYKTATTFPCINEKKRKKKGSKYKNSGVVRHDLKNVT